MNILQKNLRAEAPLYPRGAANLEYLLRATALQWENAPNENACTLHRNSFTGQWSRQNFIPGNFSSVKMDVKAILTNIIDNDSDAIIICHNHTHDDPRPSQADFRATDAISRLCRTLEVEFVDHVIFAEGSCFSFRQQGYV